MIYRICIHYKQDWKDSCGRGDITCNIYSFPPRAHILQQHQLLSLACLPKYANIASVRGTKELAKKEAEGLC
jgi:hypothetical protein